MRTTRRTTRRTLATLGLTVALGLTLAACGDDEPAGDAGAPSSTEHNDADVEFAQQMIPHHAQALVMVDMAASQDLDPEVAELTEQIRATQTPEIETMTDWLTEWGEDVPETMRDHVNSGGHSDSDDMDHDMGGDEGMPGMMSEEDLDALAGMSGQRFQEAWLEMMIAHHEGAIEMARQEQEEGRYQPALDLAAEIERSQSEEIQVMEDLLQM